MKNLNLVMLIGRVGKNVQITKTRGGEDIMLFTLIQSRTKKKGNDTKRDANIIPMVVKGKLLKLAEKIVKPGVILYTEGMLRYKIFKDEEGNNEKIKSDVFCVKIEIIKGVKEETNKYDQ